MKPSSNEVHTTDPPGFSVLGCHVTAENAPAMHTPSKKSSPIPEPTDPQLQGNKPLALEPLSEKTA